MAGVALAVGLVALAALGVDRLSPPGGREGAPSSSGAASLAPGSGSAGALASPGAGAGTASASVAVAGAPTPSPTAPGAPCACGGSAEPSSPSLVASPSPAGPVAAPPLGAAPTSARGFRPESTVVAMGFPFRPGTHVTWGAGFRSPRDGVVYPYNLIRGVAADGSLLRAHDGQDLLVPVGTIVIAPFAGVVEDPRTIWRPWDPARYGKVIVIRSTEATSPGYRVILAHLSRQSVAIGATVRRGQVVGRTGRTGNAAETIPHLHIEIRAPFLIRFGYGGVIRRLDVFDIGPSLRAAARS